MKMENNTMPKPIPKIICETKPCFSKVAKKNNKTGMITITKIIISDVIKNLSLLFSIFVL